MKPRSLSAIIWTAIAFAALVTNADFGSFRIDQPFLARSIGGVDPCAGETNVVDTLTGYSNFPITLNGLNGGCNWIGPYSIYQGTNLPAIMAEDALGDYSTTNNITGLHGGMNWSTMYTITTREDLPIQRFEDPMTEYVGGGESVDGLGKGTNWYADPITNPVAVYAWTNLYSAKGY